MRVITRKEWGAKHRNGFGKRVIPVKRVYVHHSVTKSYGPNATLKEDIAAARTVENVGQERFGGGSSYTFGITEAGRVFLLLGEDRIGAHTKGHNTDAIGIVFIGKFDKKPPSQKAIDAFEWLIADLTRRKKITRTASIRGHRDVVATSCPGAHIYKRLPAMEKVAARVRSYPRLRRGSVGGAVLVLKKRLHALGYRGMNLDSNVFGAGTQKAVRAWQDKTALVATTGEISNDDWARLL